MGQIIKFLPMTLVDSLKWRYAVKKYSDKKVEQAKIDQITEAISLAASSTGLQPYRLIVVDDKAVQKVLGEGSFNSQIAEASHLLVFAAFEKVTPEHLSDYMGLIAKVRNTPLETLDGFHTTLKFHLLESSTAEQNFNWSARQAYIGLGTGLVAAAELQVDSTPMEGFDAAKFDEVLGLKAKGLKSVVLLALGYRDEQNDAFANFKKVRLHIEEFVSYV